MASNGVLTKRDGTPLAYRCGAGTDSALAGLVFCGGFMSDMTGTKATSLAEAAAQTGRAFVRFDYFGHGATGGDPAAGTVGRWIDDALAVLDGLTDGPQILIGSSMGAWIAVRAALARPDRVAGLVTVAAAPDFTESLWRDRLTDTERRALDRGEAVERPSAYGDGPYRIGPELVTEARRHLVLPGPLPLACPVRMIHGLADPDVPWERSLALAQAIAAPDVRLTLVKDGDHRLSRPADLALLHEQVFAVSAIAGRGRGSETPAPEALPARPAPPTPATGEA